MHQKKNEKLSRRQTLRENRNLLRYQSKKETLLRSHHNVLSELEELNKQEQQLLEDLKHTLKRKEEIERKVTSHM